MSGSPGRRCYATMRSTRAQAAPAVHHSRRSGVGDTGRVEPQERSSYLRQSRLEADRVGLERARRRPATARGVVGQVTPDLKQSAFYLRRDRVLAKEEPVLTFGCQHERVRVKMTVTRAEAIQAQHLFASHQDRACGATADTGNLLPEDLELESWSCIDPSHVPAVASVRVGSAIPGKAAGPAAHQPTSESEQEGARGCHAWGAVIQ